MFERSTLQALQNTAQMFEPHEHFNHVLEHIGDASIVLLGEASHGTREFYHVRAEITRRLIDDKGFDALAVEADWPDALRVSRFIQHASQDATAELALGGFQRFPQWMWRNTEVLALINWLRQYNQSDRFIQKPEARIGFFGIDLYSLRKSMDAVVHYLEQVDPPAAQRARARYGCFDHLAEDPQRYGYAATFGLKKNCEQEVVRQLTAMIAGADQYLAHDGMAASDELFYAQQNARVAKNAEIYYRAMFLGREESWNVRDTHMLATVDALRRHITERKGKPAKIVVWAHNSHIGDARATEMGEHGQLNLGQLARQQFGEHETYLLGFTTHTGSVTAASDWDGVTERKAVRPSMQGSIENLFHETGLGDFFMPIRGHDTVQALLESRRLERAIGVIYLPESERISHYFHAYPAQQFDAIIHLDQTTAVQPLDHSRHWGHEEVPETYPSGM